MFTILTALDHLQLLCTKFHHQCQCSFHGLAYHGKFHRPRTGSFLTPKGKPIWCFSDVWALKWTLWKHSYSLQAKNQCYRLIFSFREPDELNCVQPGFELFYNHHNRTMIIVYYGICSSTEGTSAQLLMENYWCIPSCKARSLLLLFGSSSSNSDN